MVISLRSSGLLRRTSAFAVVALAIMTGLLAGCDETDDSWTRVQESGTLRVGIDPTYPPFALGGDDGVNGLDVELAAAVAAELGLEPQFIYFGYDGLYDALLTRQVDLLASALVVDPDRTRDFAYSSPYYDAGQTLLVSENDTTTSKTADLSGRRLAVELGALGHVEALAAARQIPALSVRPFGSALEAVEAVRSGKAEAALVDSTTARQYLLAQPPGAPNRLRRISPPVSSEPYAVVVRREDQELLDQLNGALQTLIETGRLDRLIRQWVGP